MDLVLKLFIFPGERDTEGSERIPNSGPRAWQRIELSLGVLELAVGQEMGPRSGSCWERGLCWGGPRGVLGGERVPENGALSGAVIPCLNVFCSKRGEKMNLARLGENRRKDKYIYSEINTTSCARPKQK